MVKRGREGGGAGRVKVEKALTQSKVANHLRHLARGVDAAEARVQIRVQGWGQREVKFR